MTQSTVANPMLAIDHIIKEQNDKINSNKPKISSNNPLELLRPSIEQRYVNIFSYLEVLTKEIQHQEEILDNRRAELQQAKAQENRRDREEIKESIVRENALYTKNETPEERSNEIINNISPKPLAGIVSSPQQVSQVVNNSLYGINEQNSAFSPIVTKCAIPNIDNEIAANTGPTKPVKMENKYAENSNEKLNTNTNININVNKNNEWQQSNRIHQNRTNNSNSLPDIPIPIEALNDEYINNRSDSFEAINNVPILDDYSYDGDEESDRIYTSNEVDVGDNGLSKYVKREVYPNEVDIVGKIAHPTDFLRSVDDSYAKDLIKGELSDTDLIFLTAATRQYKEDENHWLLSMPIMYKTIADKEYLNRIAKQLSEKLGKTISIDVSFENIQGEIPNTPKHFSHMYYESEKHKKYNELISDPLFAEVIKALDVDVSNGRFELLLPRK
ncbi:MAG: hypothetical protein ACI4V7_07115 [Succinivibrionaceae bacterium]